MQNVFFGKEEKNMTSRTQVIRFWAHASLVSIYFSIKA